jgi:Ala-tRNA(Pro) deacylase
MDIYKILEDLGIEYKIHEHQAVFTVEESLKHEKEIPGSRNKSLFLRNREKSQYYLVIIYGDKRLNTNQLTKDLNETRLSFASAEDLDKILGTNPGSVSPYTLINDTEKKVTVLIDTDVVAEDKVYFHPDRNTATLEMATDDFKKYLDWTKNKVVYLEI